MEDIREWLEFLNVITCIAPDKITSIIHLAYPLTKHQVVQIDITDNRATVISVESASCLRNGYSLKSMDRFMSKPYRRSFEFVPRFKFREELNSFLPPGNSNDSFHTILMETH
ncbi:hypothetical protein SCALIN_C31_0023 [Candidatus Scalindua japonica]|uniref:Uncharacterized protein n=1 Tax=Candidatus Scalindua japonica TaxID=1284222 RepID=A0A286U2L9_9BACT|nr:hypothetical protein [Candidatus Scalindua japonica]GAX62388.1 hypothetical protein SCALIN_C31_0023 [Candidatus Scalindua japonica]